MRPLWVFQRKEFFFSMKDAMCFYCIERVLFFFMICYLHKTRASYWSLLDGKKSDLSCMVNSDCISNSVQNLQTFTHLLR